MMSKSALLAGLALAPGSLAEHRGHGYRNVDEFIPRVPSEGAIFAEELVAEADLPTQFDWRSVNGKSYATVDWNQHIPQYCGGCWVHGTLSALNDRIKVMRGAAFPDVVLGRQSIMNCVPPADGQGPPPGCDGGDAIMIHKYMKDTKVPDESCMPWQGRNMGCDASTICRNCATNGTCWGVKNFIGYGVSSYGQLDGEDRMMKEIYARGPIACSFATDSPFMMNYSENVIQHEGVYMTNVKKNASQVDHVMEVAGWGETKSGTKYWVIRNSWGTYWGDAGWLKLQRGANTLMSESQCDWAVPTFDGLDAALQGRVWGDYANGLSTLEAVEVRAGLPPHSVSPLQAASAAGVPGAVLGATLLAEESPEEVEEGAGLLVAVLLAFTAGGAVAMGFARSLGAREYRQQSLLG